MFHLIYRRCIGYLPTGLFGTHRRAPFSRKQGWRGRLEELESRLAPASFSINSQLATTRLGEPGALATGAHAVVFFESAVADYQVLRQGLGAGTDAVLLDSGGDGLDEMAAFLAGRHDLTAIGVVAHGAPGTISLGTARVDEQCLSSHARQLAAVGTALGRGGELDVWSCDVASGQGGASLVRDLAVAMGAGVAAADHAIGSSALGGNWQLDVKVAGARGAVPFSGEGVAAFHELLGTWSTAAPMATTRAQHTATLLGNGKVLVVGGTGPHWNVLSSAELYDPASNTWSSAGDPGDMAQARYAQTATLLVNGMVLVAGGLDSNHNQVASAELYNPATGTWSSAGSMAQVRDEATATLLGNGKVLVAGGGYASAELYDPATNTWSSAGSMAQTRFWDSATLLANGMVLVAGGEYGNSSGFPINLPSAELYDPATNAWSSAGSMITARQGQAAVLLPNGKVLIAGGVGLSSAELYDPVSNTFSSAGNMAIARNEPTATLLGNGKVLVTGGYDDVGNVFATTELYDPASNAWYSAGSMATARDAQTATLLGNGDVLLAGGADSNYPLSSAELYHPSTGPDPSHCTILVTSSIPLGGTATVTLTARDETGDQLSRGGLSFSFGLGAGTGSGTFSNLTDNNDGTYTATFTGTVAGPIVINATLDGQAITGLPIVISGPNSTPTMTAIFSGGNASTYGQPVGFTATVTAGGAPVTTGTVTFEEGGIVLAANVGLDSNGQARFSDSMLSALASPHTITAVYSGASPLAASIGTVIQTVNPRAVNVAADYLSKTLGTADPPFNFHITAGSLVPGDSFTGALDRPAGESAGTYMIRQGTLALNGNYTLTYSWAVFTITPATQGNPVTFDFTEIDAFHTLVPGGTVALLVTAVDSSGRTVPGYTGTVQLTSTDNKATISGSPVPSSYTFGASDGGAHIFLVMLETPGIQTLTVTDQANTSLAGSITLTVALPSAAASFQVSAPATAITGRLFSITVTALDSSGNVATSYSGHVHFTSSDSNASLPADVGLVNGMETYSVILNTAGSQTISATDTVAAPAVMGTSRAITVAVPLPATSFQVSALGTATTGVPFNISVTALDSNGNVVTGYSGQVHFTSSDGNAILPADVTLTSGFGNFAVQVTLNTAGSQTISATDTTATPAITGTTPVITVTTPNLTGTKLFLDVGPQTTTVAAAPGTTVPVFVDVGALTSGAGGIQSGTIYVMYDPAVLSINETTVTPGTPGSDIQLGSLLSPFSATYAVDRAAGFGSGTVGIGIVHDGAASYTGTAGGHLVELDFHVLAGVSLGNTTLLNILPKTPSPFHLTIIADARGGKYTIDPALTTYGGTLTQAGALTPAGFSPADTDAADAAIQISAGTPAPTVKSLTPTAAGFTVTFSKPLDPTGLTIYGSGLNTVQDVTLVGAKYGPIKGSLVLGPSYTSITFHATANGLSLLNNFGAVVLPDDSYTVTLVSGSASGGFRDALGVGLDGTSTGSHANYTATFTTHFQADATPVLAIPDFARGPDGASTIKVPNDTGFGIPITLYRAANVTDVTFTLSYNPALLNVTAGLGGAQSDATLPATTFTLVGTPTIIDATHATASFHFHSATDQSGTVVLGDIQATVPNSAAGNYKATELLQLGTIVINNGAISGAQSANAIHVNAYFGDVSGNGAIDGLDVATAFVVARGDASGFAAYPLLDPAIVGDVAFDYSVDAGDVSDLASLTVHLPTPTIAAIPTGLTITPTGADPTPSLGEPEGVSPRSLPASFHVRARVSVPATSARLVRSATPAGAGISLPAAESNAPMVGMLAGMPPGATPGTPSTPGAHADDALAVLSPAAALTPITDAPADLNMPIAYSDTVDSLLWGSARPPEDWLAASSSSAYAESAATHDPRGAGGQGVADRSALVDKVFAQLADGGDDLSWYI